MALKGRRKRPIIPASEDKLMPLLSLHLRPVREMQIEKDHSKYTKLDKQALLVK